MRGLLLWLMGLDRIPTGDDGPLSLRFATPPAPWIMLAGAVLAAFAIDALYRREQTQPRWRRALVALRFGAIMTVLFILGQPLLVLRRNHVDPSRVAILVDRSMSMTAPDVEPVSGGKNRSTRWAAAVDGLFRADTGLVPRLAGKQQLTLSTFAEHPTTELEIDKPSGVESAREHFAHVLPDGSRTDLASAIATTLEQTQGSPLAAIIIASDGRETHGAALEAALAQAQARSVPVHVICTGSSHPLPDLRIDSAVCEEDVFVRDTVVVRVRPIASGYDDPVDAEIQLKDKASGAVLGARKVRLSPNAASPIDLAFQPMRAGRMVVTTSITPRGDEANTDNNAVDLPVNARDEKIAVLYVEGSPRYEYRYLKNMLLREPGVESSCLLLSATPGFTQEGTRSIRRFPQSVEELRQYDVILFGDVDPRADWISPVQITMLADHVTQQGGGIAFLAGESFVPHRLRQTPLEKLLPVRIDPDFMGKYDHTLTDTFAPRLTIEGKQSGLFGVAIDEQESDQWIGARAGWYWFARVLGTQPASTVLLTHPSALAGESAMPLAVLGRAGAGRTFYLGTDDLWRWRQAIGEVEYEAFWLRVIRTLARGRKLGGDCPWRLDLERRKYEVGDTVNIRLAASDGILSTDASELTLSVLEAQRGLTERVALRPTNPGAREFEATFVPSKPGQYELVPQLPEQPHACRKLSAVISVAATDYERLRPEADPEFLRLIAARTNGRFLRVTDDLSGLADVIPDRSLQIPDDVEEPLWDKPCMLALFGVLVIVEWSLRKARGLT